MFFFLAKIRKRYNQIPHPTQDTKWESNKNTIHITNKSQEVSPFPAGEIAKYRLHSKVICSLPSLTVISLTKKERERKKERESVHLVNCVVS